jgi:hypothetical protein
MKQMHIYNIGVDGIIYGCIEGVGIDEFKQ